MMTIALLATGASYAHAQEDNYACLVAAHRILFFTIQEADGSKLEQMAKSIEEKGGHSAVASVMAPSLDPNRALLLSWLQAKQLEN